jgi:hypothetical protein
MNRKPDATIQINLRVRESMRRRLERAAEKQGTSMNYQITSRIEAAFDQEHLRTIDAVTRDLESHAARIAAADVSEDRLADLRRCVEALIPVLDGLPPDCRHQVLEAGVADIKQCLARLDREVPIDPRTHYRLGSRATE